MSGWVPARVVRGVSVETPGHHRDREEVDGGIPGTLGWSSHRSPRVVCVEGGRDRNVEEGIINEIIFVYV